MARLKTLPQVVLAVLFVLTVSGLTYAASMADVPQSSFVPPTLSAE